MPISVITGKHNKKVYVYPRRTWDVSDSDSDTNFSFCTKIKVLASLRKDSPDDKGSMSRSGKKILGKTKEVGFRKEEGHTPPLRGTYRGPTVSKLSVTS